MDIDNVFNTYAEFGYYQKQLFACLSGIQIFGAFHNIHNVFLGAEPEFYCVQNGKKIHGCPKTGTCDEYYYPGDDFTSIVSEFDLVCENSYKANLVQSLYMAALFLGSILYGKLADGYGRKKIGIICILGMTGFSLLGMFATSYSFYVACRAISATFNGGWGLISFILLTEVIGGSKRSLAGTVVPASFGLGIAIYAMLGFLIREWRMLTFVTSVPGLVGIYFIWFLPESPRWLFSRKKIAEAEAVLNDIITRNDGRPPKQPIKLYDPFKEPITVKVTEDKTDGLKQTHKSQSGSSRSDRFSDLFKVPVLRSRTLNNIYTWFANCCVYYGLTIGLGNLGGNLYVSVGLSGLVEIPAYMLALYMIESKLGRKYTYSWTMLFGGALCVSMILIPSGNSMIQSSAALLGKMAISLSFSVAWLYSAEMYPTSLRNQGVSLCSGSSRLGGMISPLIYQMSRKYPYIDFISYGVMTFIAGLLALKLPETHNQPLPENVSDLVRTTEHGSNIQVLESFGKVKTLMVASCRKISKVTLPGWVTSRWKTRGITLFKLDKYGKKSKERVV